MATRKELAGSIGQTVYLKKSSNWGYQHGCPATLISLAQPRHTIGRAAGYGSKSALVKIGDHQYWMPLSKISVNPI